MTTAIPIMSGESKAAGDNILGKLLVRVVRAKYLAIGDAGSLMHSGSSDPYVRLCVCDTVRQMQSLWRMTRTIKGTIDPHWGEEFAFTVRSLPEHLSLRLEVWDDDSDEGGGGETDDFLGQAVVNLDEGILDQSRDQRFRHELVLEADEAKESMIEPRGKIVVETHWIPHSGVVPGWFTCGVCRTLLAPHVQIVLGIAQLGTAGFLFLIASDVRWLCHGNDLTTCKTSGISGPGLCALLAAMLSFMLFGVHFFGATGFCGKQWLHTPPSIADLVEIDGRHHGPRADEVLELRVSQAHLTHWKIGVGTNILPQFPMPGLRLVAWLIHAASLLLASIAAVITSLEDGIDEILAEGFYLNLGASFLQVSAAISLILADHWSLELDVWGPAEGDEKRAPSGERRQKASRSPSVEDRLLEFQHQAAASMSHLYGDLKHPLLTFQNAFHLNHMSPEQRDNSNGRAGQQGTTRRQQQATRVVVDSVGMVDEATIGPEPSADFSFACCSPAVRREEV